jgi:hypothetical protein
MVSIVNYFSDAGMLVPQFWVIFWYLDIRLFIAETIVLQVLFILVLRKECQTSDEFLKSILNLPLFYVYALHWFWVFWKATLFYRKATWQNTKTEHGFR